MHTEHFSFQLLSLPFAINQFVLKEDLSGTPDPTEQAAVLLGNKRCEASSQSWLGCSGWSGQQCVTVYAGRQGTGSWHDGRAATVLRLWPEAPLLLSREL